MERQKFNEEWKKAFDQAEISPTENVWVNIELDLEKAKGSQLRKRLVFYQLLAAASVVFSIGVGVSVYLLNDNTSAAFSKLAQQSVQMPAVEKTESTVTAVNENESIASANESTASVKKSTPSKESTSSVKESTSSGNESIASVKESTSVNTENSSIADVSQGKATESVKAGSLTDITKTSSRKGNIRKKETNTTSNSGTIAPDKATPDKALLLASSENSVREEYTNLAKTNSGLPVLVRVEKIELQFLSPQKETTTADPVMLMMARLEQREKEVQAAKEDKKELSEKLWTSVGFAAGSFNAVNGGVSSPSSTSAFAMNKPNAEEEAKAPGITYSMGVNMGTKLSERWVLQGGVNYLTQSADYTANTAVRNVQSDNSSKFSAQSLNAFSQLDEKSTMQNQVVATAPYNVNNNLRYLSIPLQAGYLIVNRAFGLQLNAGVSTDLFLQNTVTPEGQNLDKTTQGPGGDSPYRTVNLSGLMGTELSYRFRKHYRIALNPGVRYPFNSIYQSDVEVKSTPLSFDVGLRFRYIFH